MSIHRCINASREQTYYTLTEGRGQGMDVRKERENGRLAGILHGIVFEVQKQMSTTNRRLP